jgi:hypothetical protein
VRLARDRRRADEAVGETFAHALRDGFVLPGGERIVLGDQLDHVADALELHDLVQQHHAAVHALLADAAAQVGREEQRLAELVRGDLDPRLLVLSPGTEQPWCVLGVLDDVGKWPRLALGDGRGGSGGGGRGRGRGSARGAGAVGLGRIRRGHRGGHAGGGGIRGCVTRAVRRKAGAAG